MKSKFCAHNKLRSISITICLMIASQGVMPVMAQDQDDLAVANEIVISASPLHDRVAEKYLVSATGDREVELLGSTNSAVKLHIPLDESVPEGAIVENDEIDQTCAKFRNYIRKLRQSNSAARSSNDRPKIIYNFQCSANAIMSISAVPNDSRINELWAVTQSNNVDLDLPEAWDKSTGSSDVVVAVIDTGIDFNHPDLVANMWKNPAELNGLPGVDDDANGVIDDIYGRNAIWANSNPGSPMDDHNHGTHVAGTIGGVGNNGVGVAGVAWNVKLMGAKFLSSTGSGSLFDAITALDYITNQKLAGVNVVATNNSWGGGGFYAALRDAITRSNNAGILFIAAAGNQNVNIDVSPSYPASYDVPNVISVGAIDAAGSMAWFSNYGAQNVDVVAPGVSILSSIRGTGYSYFNGTSMATPQVSGVIALLKGYAPAMSAVELKDALFNTGKYVPAAAGKSKFASIPSALNMLLEADRLGYGGVPPTPTKTPTSPPTATPLPTPTSVPTPTPTPTIAPGLWTVGGLVKVGGNKLAGAKVIIEVGGQTLVTYTDANGAFSFVNIVGPANYIVKVNAGGYSFENFSGTLQGNASINLLGTPKNYLLRAKVTNELGEVLEGVSISDPVLGNRTTSNLGIVEFTVPYGSSYVLNAQHAEDEFLDASLSGQIFGDVTRAFVKLPE